MRFPVAGRLCSSAAVAALAGAATAALILQTLAGAQNATATIENFTFAPERLIVKAGTTVTWRNEDDIPHTVASDTRLFKSKALDTGDAFSFTFGEPGSYAYFCSLHPHMTGTVVVER